MKYVHLAIAMLVVIACGYQTAAAGGESQSNPWNPWNPWESWGGETANAPGTGEPLMFAQNTQNPPDEEEIRDQFLDSYFHNVPIPRSTDPWYRVRVMIMWHLVDYLQIDEDTAKVFFPIYSDYMKKRNDLMDEQRRLTESVSASVEDESSDVKALRKNAERLETIESDLVKLRRDFLHASEDRLTPRQYVKLFVFDEKMKNDLLRRILPDGRRGGGDPNRQDNRFPNPQDNGNRGFGR